jgi:hypothetical protein
MTAKQLLEQTNLLIQNNIIKENDDVILVSNECNPIYIETVSAPAIILGKEEKSGLKRINAHICFSRE